MRLNPPAVEALLPGGPPRLDRFPGWVDPIRALGLLRGRRAPVLLYSGLAGRHPEARHSILAWDPVAVIAVRAGTLLLSRGPSPDAEPRRLPAADPFATLRELLPATAAPSGLPFCGGAIGYLGYGLRGAIERLPRGGPEPLDLPDAWFGVYDTALLFDHAAREVRLVRPEAEGEEAAAARRAALRPIEEAASGGGPVADAAGAEGDGGAMTAGLLTARTRTPRRDYEAAVREVLSRIARGDLYQVNLSHRITAPCAEPAFDLFARLMRDNPAPFSAYIDTGSWQILSASPERFVALRGDVARSSPIKGTRPRGAFPEEDLLHADDLRGSVKDRAENVMIADLVRNDLGRVCRPGSVVVEDLCRLESFATVHHLVTTVRGRLRGDRDRFDLLRALFPGGSMTGAPKVAAMQAIAALEEEERGAYSGAIGYLSKDGACDFNIVIRTLACGGGQAHFRVGGGIVADSDPEREWLETLDKGRALLDVLGARLDSGDEGRAGSS